MAKDKRNPFPVQKSSAGNHVTGKYAGAWLSQETYTKLRLLCVVEGISCQQIIARVVERELDCLDEAGLPVCLDVLAERTLREWLRRKQQLKPGHVKRAWFDYIDEVRGYLRRWNVDENHIKEIVERLKQKSNENKGKKQDKAKAKKEEGKPAEKITGTDSSNISDMAAGKTRGQSKFMDDTTTNETFEATLTPAFIKWGGFSVKKPYRKFLPDEKQRFTINFHGFGEVKAYTTQGRIKLYKKDFRNLSKKLAINENSKFKFYIIRPKEYYEASKVNAD